MSEKMDRRVRKTRAQMRAGLAYLMKTKSIKEITVKDLVEAADINRSTFYLHYTDIYTMLETIENDLICQVQTAIDPEQNAGEGLGIAPIGHVVKVHGVEAETVDLSFSLYYQRGWAWDDVKGYVTDAVNSYFLELAKSWADQEGALVCRISQVESRLLDIDGILDIAGTKLNGAATNYALALDHIPVLGEITASTITISA